MTEPRSVFDTSVAVSAILMPRSVPRQAFDRAIEVGTLLLSEATLTELDEVLRRTKFDKYVSEPKRLEFLLSLVELAETVPNSQQITACRDPKDDKFLELAVSGGANFIVSGDADLLSLHPFQGIEIITPQQFLTVVPACD
jgi:uncharacterized protein